MWEHNNFLAINTKLEEINQQVKRNIKLLHVFEDSSKQFNAILVTNEDKVYCFGPNKMGFLGFGHETNVNKFTINEILNNKQIVDIKNSLYHTIARTFDGKILCWGQNYCLGNGIKDLKISQPKVDQVLINENIIDMCCGSSHTLVLTSNGEVYAWGWNEVGQIGNDSNSDVFKPFKLNDFNGEKVKAICCGHNHSMALMESGCVYSWGHNNRGQLGFESKRSKENKPTRIQIEIKIMKIICGQKHSLLLSDEGVIYWFGYINHFGTTLKAQWTPIRINHSEKFSDIASHFNYNISAALSKKQIFYVWGKSEEGVLTSEPKTTHFQSFNQIFVNYCGITLNNWNSQEECLTNLLSLKKKGKKVMNTCLRCVGHCLMTCEEFAENDWFCEKCLQNKNKILFNGLKTGLFTNQSFNSKSFTKNPVNSPQKTKTKTNFILKRKCCFL